LLIPAPEKISTISGTVNDLEGSPLVGVSVQIKGGQQGTVTDEEGHYELEVSEEATLIFSYVGYETQEVEIRDRNTIDITMKAVSSGLNEVVVVGYGTQKKENLTGAVDQVSGERLENRPITNVSEGLQGLIPS